MLEPLDEVSPLEDEVGVIVAEQSGADEPAGEEFEEFDEEDFDDEFDDDFEEELEDEADLGDEEVTEEDLEDVDLDDVEIGDLDDDEDGFGADPTAPVEPEDPEE